MSRMKVLALHEPLKEKEDSSKQALPTKERLLHVSVELFAVKGFTETSVREIAAAAGIKEASLYNHFSTKNDILYSILADYSQHGYIFLDTEEKRAVLRENPTPEGIVSCLTIDLPKEREDQLSKELFVILQEQCRNPMMQSYVCDRIIHHTETQIREILEILIESGVIHPDIDVDYWCKLHGSVVYTFANRALLGIADHSPNYEGLTMRELVMRSYENMFQMYGIKPEHVDRCSGKE